MFAQARPFLLALLIGLLIGVERTSGPWAPAPLHCWRCSAPWPGISSIPPWRRCWPCSPAPPWSPAICAPPRRAVLAILGAFLANMTVKLTLAGWIGGRSLLVRVAPPMLAMMAAAGVAYWGGQV